MLPWFWVWRPIHPSTDSSILAKFWMAFQIWYRLCKDHLKRCREMSGGTRIRQQSLPHPPKVNAVIIAAKARKCEMPYHGIHAIFWTKIFIQICNVRATAFFNSSTSEASMACYTSCFWMCRFKTHGWRIPSTRPYTFNIFSARDSVGVSGCFLLQRLFKLIKGCFLIRIHAVWWQILTSVA